MTCFEKGDFRSEVVENEVSGGFINWKATGWKRCSREFCLLVMYKEVKRRVIIVNNSQSEENEGLVP